MKYLLSIILMTVLMLGTGNVSYAATITPGEGDGGSGPTTSVPNISDIADPLIRVFNLLLLAGGIIFMLMIFYSAYKYSLAQGDPKGIMLAKETLTHAVYGFIVTVGAFTIVTIVSNILGLDTAILNDPGKTSKSAIEELCTFLGGCDFSSQ